MLEAFIEAIQTQNSDVFNEVFDEIVPQNILVHLTVEVYNVVVQNTYNEFMEVIQYVEMPTYYLDTFQEIAVEYIGGDTWNNLDPYWYYRAAINVVEHVEELIFIDDELVEAAKQDLEELFNNYTVNGSALHAPKPRSVWPLHYFISETSDFIFSRTSDLIMSHVTKQLLIILDTINGILDNLISMCNSLILSSKTGDVYSEMLAHIINQFVYCFLNVLNFIKENSLKLREILEEPGFPLFEKLLKEDFIHRGVLFRPNVRSGNTYLSIVYTLVHWIVCSMNQFVQSFIPSTEIPLFKQFFQFVSDIVDEVLPCSGEENYGKYHQTTERYWY